MFRAAEYGMNAPYVYFPPIAESEIRESPLLLSYSRFKLGSLPELQQFAEALASQIARSAEYQSSSPQGGLIASVAGHAIPKVAALLGVKIAELLGMSSVGLQLSDQSSPTYWRNYSKTGASERRELVQDKFSVPSGGSLEGKSVFLIDDMIITGTMICAAEKTLYAAGASRVSTHVIASFAGTSRSEIEHEINSLALETDPVGFIQEILLPAESIYTTRLMSFVYELTEAEFISLLHSLPTLSLVRFYANSIFYFGHNLPSRFLQVDRLVRAATRLEWPAMQRLQTDVDAHKKLQLADFLASRQFRFFAGDIDYLFTLLTNL